MAKPNLGDLNKAVQDPLTSDNIQLNIPNLPAGVSGDSKNLLMLCRTGTKPGVTINGLEVQGYGHTLEFAGNLTYNHDLAYEYTENRGMVIHDTVESWLELIRNHETQHGAYKSEYAVNAYLTFFENKGNVVREYKINNIWPTSIGDVSWDGTQASVVTVSVTWKFDWSEKTK